MLSVNLTHTVFAENKLSNDRSIIKPSYGTKVPLKNETRTDPATGIKITRLTDASELSGSSDALIVYSRYSPENSTGKYILVFGSNSNSSWVVDRTNGKIITRLRSDYKHDIGENHEIRWDYSGKHPNRIYFVKNMRFYMIDDIHHQDKTRQLIKDFSKISPNSTKIYNDVEGDSSNDSDHWAWMAVHYNGTTNVVDAFIHYQVSTKTVNTLFPEDLAQTPLKHYATAKTFPRPNMVEVSPLGTGIVLHYGRAWGNEKYGNRSNDIKTWFDGAYLWPLDFKFKKQEPFKISIDQTHSGWSFDDSGNEYFISQNNRTDKFDAVNLINGKKAFTKRLQIASHGDFGWSNGFHFGKMPLSKSGWVFTSSYSKAKATKNNWGNNQLLLLQLKTKAPKILRIGSNYNYFSGNYRDEAPAAINLIGNRVYLSTNWGGKLDHREVFVIDLPDNWNTEL